MAAAAQQLGQSSIAVEGRLKTLLNNDLKTICKAYDVPVSGNKVQLQQRCITVLRNIVQRGDHAGFTAFSARVNNHGELPTTMSQPTRTYTNVLGGNGAAMRGPLPPSLNPPRMEFRNSPFYERLEVVLRSQDLPEMPQNRHTVKSNLILNDVQAQRLAADPEQYRLMVYCASPSLIQYQHVDISFPPQIEIKVNDDDVKANFRGLKNKPGSTKPADITKLVRLKPGYTNRLTVCYALTKQRFAYIIYLVRYVSPATLVDKIRSNRVFPKAKVLEEYARRNADPDIAATLSKMSLKDPVSTLRISLPIRSTICSHNQCFDASFFLQLQEQAPTWQCPICSRTVSFESLSVDKYFEEILQSTPQAIEQVAVEPNGEWQAVKEDEGDRSNGAPKPRAAYDHDSDDEVIELDDDEPPAAIKKEPAANSFNAFSASPLVSRSPSITQSQAQSAPKRQSAVIDLTLSDDDDEPIRAPKRPRVEPPPQRTTPFLPTPGSLYPGRPQATQPSGLHPLPARTDFESGNTNGTVRSPLSSSPFTTNAAPAAAFGRVSELPRPNTHLGNPSTNSLNPWTSFRSPPPPMSHGTDLHRRPSESENTGLLGWQPHLHKMTQQSSMPTLARSTSATSTYSGFADNHYPGNPPARDMYGVTRMPNGFPANPASPS